MQIITRNPDQTIKLGIAISGLLQKGDILALFGNLGSGKTTLVKGIAKGLRVKSRIVNSPSFVLLKEYEGRLPLYHFDFYRIEKPEETYGIGLEEFLFGKGVCVIEWADRIRRILPKQYLRLDLKFLDKDRRKISMSGFGRRYRELVKKYENTRI